MGPLPAFPQDYAAARERFRMLSAERGWLQEAHPVAASGHDEWDLTIDAARLGPAGAENLLILSSGLHGVEAPFGSAVQLAWLESLPRAWQPPTGWRILLLHALNPWGFAHLRRFNEDNIDLNRNFLEASAFDELRRGDEESNYRRFDRHLNPPRPPGRFNLFPLLAGWMIVRHGKRRLRQVLPVGQYAFPKGLFFGGHGPARSTQIVMENAPRWVGSAKRIIHLDFHTGLGEWGRLKLLSVEAPDAPLMQRAMELFGRESVEPHGGPTAYASRGDMGVWLSRRFADREYLCLVAEFGAYPAVHTLGALRGENQAHHWGDPASRSYRRAKERFVEAFVPRSPQWREMVVRQALRLIDRAVGDAG
jgi:Protein of unknown function (DUF2817)